MDSRCQEFVCLDCKADVYSFGGPGDETRCASCELMRSLRFESPIDEAALRVILGCEIPENDNAVRQPDESPGRQDAT